MKKFFITLLILIVLAGAAFFFGWANFAVPPGCYGVISSKTHGLDPKIVEAGEFRWIWYKLIPTNVNISIFRADQKQLPIDIKGSLPSGETYAQFVGLNNIDFSWELKGNMSFTVNPDILVNITTQNNITNQDELDGYMQKTAERISLFILNSMTGSSPEEIESILSGKDFSVTNKIIGQFTQIKDFSLIINNAKFPDFSLYMELRAIYEEFLREQRKFVTSSFGQRADNHIQFQLRIAELEKYGELLTKYPILLDYLTLEKGQ